MLYFQFLLMFSGLIIVFISLIQVYFLILTIKLV